MNLSMDLIKLLHGFVKVVLCISRPLPNKTMLKFDQNFKACVSGRLIYLLKSYQIFVLPNVVACCCSCLGCYYGKHTQPMGLVCLWQCLILEQISKRYKTNALQKTIIAI